MPTDLSALRLPTGYTRRAVSYDDTRVDTEDLAAIMTVVQASELAFAGAVDSTSQQVAASLTGPDLMREESVLVLNPTGAVVGVGWYELDRAGRQAYTEAYIHPDDPGADTVQAWVLAHGYDVATRRVEDRSGWKLRAGCLLGEDAYTRTLAAQGFTPVRRFWRMEIAADSPAVPPLAPLLPSGVSIDSGGSEEHRRAVYEVDQASFADHWDFWPRDYDEAWRHVMSEPGARPEYWWLLRVDGVPAAVCLRNDEYLELGRAYVSVLGVLREYRGRGLARLLLQRVFVQARDDGLAGISLHVDAQNATGATALYESVGMVAAQTYVAHERPLN